MTPLRDLRDQTMTETVDADSAPSSPKSSSSPASRYVVLGEFARGGLGCILTARDQHLDRLVAIKELLSTESRASVERFQRETAITARLQHPAIMPLYDAGAGPNGRPFYVMKLLSNGRTLKQVVADSDDVDQRLALLPNVIAVADAIAYAHSLGIIHRDIKPSNVIIGPFGETVVIDWGVAKELSQPDLPTETAPPFPYRTAEPDVTAAGTILGTPHYMAPEQARGEAVDKRADVYALGALVYHVLVGRAPFSSKLPHEILQSVASGTPPLPLAEAARGLAPDLIAVVEKAMARDPSQRYADAEELAQDLKRFQTGQLVGAHDYSGGALIRRWLGRHKVLSAVTAAFLVILAVFSGASVRRIRAERSIAVAERNRLILAQAKAALPTDPTLAVQWLKAYPSDGVGWGEVQTLAADAYSRGIARHLLPTMAPSFAIFPDGKRVVTGGPERLVDLWDLVSGAQLRSESADDDVSSVRVSPDGDFVAVSDRAGGVSLWSVKDGARRHLGQYQTGAFRLAFAPRGGRLASASLDTVTLWSLASATVDASTKSADTITTLAFSPDGETIAFGTTTGTLNLWQPSRASLRRLTGHVGAVNSIAFSPDDKLILTGGNDRTVRVWDRATGRGRILGSHDDLVRVVRFSPTEPLAASGGVDHKVRLWSLDGSAPRVLTTSTDTVNDVAFSPDGRTVASCGPDRLVHLYDLSSGDERMLRGHHADLGDVAFSPDGTTLVSAGYDKQSRVWNLSAPASSILGRHRMVAAQVLFSPDGSLVASVGSDRIARLWDLRGNERALRGSEYSGMESATRARFSADGRILIGAGDHAAHIWNVKTGESHAFVVDGALPETAAISADGGLVAVGGSDGKIRVWDTDTMQQRSLIGHKGPIYSLAFLTQGKMIVSAGVDATVRTWDLSSQRGEVIGTLAATPTAFMLADDGETLAIGDAAGNIEVRNLRTRSLRTLHGPPDPVWVLAFSHDARRLASAGSDNETRIWNLAGGEPGLLRSHDDAVRAAAFSADGKLLATGANDRTIHIANLENGSLAILRGHAGPVRSLAFSADSTHLVSASDDGVIRMWQMRAVSFVPQERAALMGWMKRQTTAPRPSEMTDSTATSPRR